MKGVRGMRALFGSELASMNAIISVFQNIGMKYNFKSIQVPLVGPFELYQRESSQDTDISKELYSFEDKKQRHLALRPEFTASILFEYINNLQKTTTDKRFMTHGTLYRYDRPQKGRYREFHQFNVEAFGRQSYVEDYELLEYADTVLKDLSIRDDITLEINSLGNIEDQQNYEKVLKEFFYNNLHGLSPDSQVKIESNPLRILDSKDIIDEYIIDQAPKSIDYLSEQSSLYFNNLTNLLDSQQIEYVVNPNLVRGLDYYTHTVFEFVSNTHKFTVIGGGRYDKLATLLGSSKDIPAVGLAAGLDRLVSLTTSLDTSVEEKKKKHSVAIIPIEVSHESLIYSLEVLKKIRSLNMLIGELFSEESKLDRKFKRGYTKDIIIIIGKKEIEENCITLKFTKTKEEIYISKDKLELDVIVACKLIN